MSAPVTLYTTRYCPYCVRAKQLLDAKGVSYREIGVDAEPQRRREMMERSGQRTVPQIWIGERHVGGCDDLYDLERRGQLDALLA
ncbi:MAG: glutaredoxin 3 [Halioglobus sp.]|nr:glutaredoxin 3 [Halioglobus sp.]